MCVRAHVHARVCFYCPHFSKSLPTSPGFLGDVPGDAVCKVMWSNMKMGRQNNALRKEKRKIVGGGAVGREKRDKFLKKKKTGRVAACRASGCESTPSCSLAAAKRQRANEAVDKYLITPTTNTQRAQTDKVLLMVSGCFE